jgi:hypothetical protein
MGNRNSSGKKNQLWFSHRCLNNYEECNSGVVTHNSASIIQGQAGTENMTKRGESETNFAGFWLTDCLPEFVSRSWRAELENTTRVRSQNSHHFSTLEERVLIGGHFWRNDDTSGFQQDEVVLVFLAKKTTEWNHLKLITHDLHIRTLSRHG